MTDEGIDLILGPRGEDAIQSQIHLREEVNPASAQPSYQSHDPQINLKRSDSFQFGSRYLQEGDDVYAFNAWDHVEADDAYKEYAEVQYAKQREYPVSEFDKSKPT